MESVITLFDKGSEGYQKLEAVAGMMTAFSTRDKRYTVEVTYFDFGQDWKWTTIIEHDKGGRGWLSSCQALNPAEQEKILYGDIDEVMKVVKDIATKKWSER